MSWPGPYARPQKPQEPQRPSEKGVVEHVIVRSFKDIEGTDRHVRSASGTWESKRIVLAKERVGFSLHETVLYAGTKTSMWYANHVEAVVCVEGEALLTDDETGRTYTITPGTMYLLDGHERHTMRIKEDFRCLCVFNPPVTGREDHDENGVYPLLTEPDPDPGFDHEEV